MKLIINIPDFVYDDVRALKGRNLVKMNGDAMHDAIYNGTPLDDVKAEIQAKEMVETNIEKQFYNMALGDVIEILDNIGKADMRDKI